MHSGQLPFLITVTVLQTVAMCKKLEDQARMLEIHHNLY